MASVVERPKADATFTTRIPARIRELIDSAAAVEGRFQTEFVAGSARLHAMDVLLDQRVFTLDFDQSATLAEVLGNPPNANTALRDLMHAKAPWA